MSCSKCGEVSTSGANFCSKCGAELGAVTPTAGVESRDFWPESWYLGKPGTPFAGRVFTGKRWVDPPTTPEDVQHIMSIDKYRSRTRWLLGGLAAIGVGVVLMVTFPLLNVSPSTPSQAPESEDESDAVSEMHREVIEQYWQASPPDVRVNFCLAHSMDRSGGMLFVPLLRGDFGITIRTEKEAQTWARAGDELLAAKCE